MDKRFKMINNYGNVKVETNGEIKLEDISKKIIEKYNLEVGHITPFTYLKIVN